MFFYLYSNKNSVFNYLSRNLIASESIVPEICGNRTISTKTDHFLFVTHKKLNRTSREFGISAPKEVYPITLEINIYDDVLKGNFRVILVENDGGKNKYELGRWNQYDSSLHFGAIILGEIPLSCVSHILFDDEYERDGFRRPSPDYWYPEDKFKLISDDFSEELMFEISEKEISTQIGIDFQKSEVETRKREKLRAAILNLYNATQTWKYGKYRMNMDGYLQSLLKLSDQFIQESIPNYTVLKQTNINQELDLLPMGDSSIAGESLNQRLFTWIFNDFAAVPYGEIHTTEFFADCFRKISIELSNDNHCNKCIKKIFDEINLLICGNSSKMIEDLLSEMEPNVDVLKALLFVAKNPDDYHHFIESLEKYHLDVINTRRACVLWGALNGLKGMPGESHNKSNQTLWQFIEWYVLSKDYKFPVSVNVQKPEMISDNRFVFGICLASKEEPTFEEIYELIKDFMMEMPNNCLERVKDLVSKKLGQPKFENKYISYKWPKFLEEEVSKEELTKRVEAIKKSPIINKEKLFKDWIEPYQNFKILYDRNPGEWEKIFMELRSNES